MDPGSRDRKYMVASASRGLGFAIAKARAAMQLEETTGARVIGVSCDVRDPRACEAWTVVVDGGCMKTVW